VSLAEIAEHGREHQHPVLTRHRERLKFGEKSKADSRHSTSSLRLRSGLAWQAEGAELWRKTVNKNKHVHFLPIKVIYFENRIY